MNAQLSIANRWALETYYRTIVLLSVSMVLGIIGNIHSILVYWIYYKKNNMRNYVLILSVVDLLSCCSSNPLLIYYFCDFFNLHVFICKSTSFIAPFTYSFSYGLLAIIAVDRLKHIAKPFGKQLSYFHSKLACFLCGIFAFILSFPQLFLVSNYKTNVFIEINNSTLLASKCLAVFELAYTVNLFVIMIYQICCVIICFVSYAALCIILMTISNKTSLTTNNTPMHCFQRLKKLSFTKLFNKRAASFSDSQPNPQVSASRFQYTKGIRTSLVFLVVTCLSCLCALPNIHL